MATEAQVDALISTMQRVLQEISDLVSELRGGRRRSSASSSPTVDDGGALGSALGDMDQMQGRTQELRDRLMEMIELHGDLRRKHVANSGEQKKKLEMLMKELELLNEIKNEMNKNNGVAQEQLDNVTKMQAHYTQSLEEGRRLLQGMVKDDLGDLRAAVGSVGMQFEQWPAQIGRVIQELQRARDKGISFGTAMAEAISTGGVTALKGLANATMELAVEQDKAISQFKRWTGASMESEEVLIKTYQETKEFGVSQTEAMESVAGLARSMTSFNSLSNEAKQELGEFSSKLGEVGVDSMVAGEAIDTLNVGLGMTREASIAAAERLVKIGSLLGDPNRAMQDFAATAPQLAKWGDQTFDVFEDLSKGAQALGVQMKELTDIALGMDSFEDAAEAASGLNLVLGGNLINSTDLLLASEEERIRMLIQTIDASGRAWDELDRFEKKHIAASAGVKDLTTANKIFGKSLEEYDKEVLKNEERIEQQKEIEERAKEYQSIQEELNIAIQEFVISMRPAILMLKDMIQGFSGFVREYPWVARGLVVLIAGFKLLPPIFKLFGATSGIAGKGVEKLGDSVGRAGPKFMKAVPAALAFGASALMVGAGVGLAAWGVSVLVGQLTRLDELGVVALAVALGGMTLAIMAMGSVGAGAAPGLLAISLAFLSMGAAVLMVGFGLKLALDAFSGFISTAAANSDVLAEIVTFVTQIAISVGGLAYALGALGIVAPMAFVGLAGVAAGLLLIAGSVALIKTDDLIALGDIFMGLGKVAESGKSFASLGSGISNMVEDLERVAGLRGFIMRTIESINIDLMAQQLMTLRDVLADISAYAESFSSAMTPVAATVKVISVEENVRRYERFADATKGVMITSAAAASAGGTKALKDLADAVRAQGAAAGGGSQGPIEVVVNLDGKEVARTVVNHMDDQKKTMLGSGRR